MLAGMQDAVMIRIICDVGADSFGAVGGVGHSNGDAGMF